MKVLHINTYDRAGGAEQVAWDLCHSQKDSKLLVKTAFSNSDRVITFQRNRLDKFHSAVDRFIRKLNIKKSYRELLFLKDQLNSTVKKLKTSKEYQEADIIHLHNIHGGYFDLNALDFIAKEKKVVWTMHDMWAMTGGEACVLDNDNYKLGIGSTPYKHFPPINNPIIDRRQHFLDLKRSIYQRNAKNIHFVAVSKWLEKCFKESYVFNQATRSTVIYNGVDCNNFSNLGRRKWSKPRVAFFNTGSIIKDSSNFFNVIEKIKIPFDFYLVGKQFRIQNRNINLINCPYIMNRAELNSFFNSIDILVFTSLSETFGLLVAEAMASGVCVIASNVGGLPEVISSIELGYLVNNESKDLELVIVDALVNLTKSRSIGTNAATHINTNFSKEEAVRSYYLLYSELLKVQ